MWVDRQVKRWRKGGGETKSVRYECVWVETDRLTGREVEKGVRKRCRNE